MNVDNARQSAPPKRSPVPGVEAFGGDDDRQPGAQAAFFGTGELTMKRLFLLAAVVLSLSLQIASAQQSAPPTTRRGGQGRGGATPAPIHAKPEELATIKEKTEQIQSLVKDLKASGAKPELVGDVEVYAHAGQMLIE